MAGWKIVCSLDGKVGGEEQDLLYASRQREFPTARQALAVQRELLMRAKRRHWTSTPPRYSIVPIAEEE
jgi:hypothetical protein